ncbi:hypothetical protein BJV74DRAFT_821008 [Russula compacta]|nr:hypothetical protein BJV74DRAFT_821008 [Russula compacta]
MWVQKMSTAALRFSATFVLVLTSWIHDPLAPSSRRRALPIKSRRSVLYGGVPSLLSLSTFEGPTLTLKCLNRDTIHLCGSCLKVILHNLSKHAEDMDELL